MSDNFRIQFITHFTTKHSYIESARLALEGGCRWIQFRMKDADDSLLEESALIIKEMCRKYGATFIIDDHVLLAKRANADGVHLGKNDMPIDQARKILGNKFIIGGTINSFEDILRLTQGARPDYFGCGPFRYTSTKKNLAPILGHEGYRHIIQKMHEANINIPLVAIGGICLEDISELFKTGVSGIAISGSVLRADNPEDEMRRIINLNNKHYD